MSACGKRNLDFGTHIFILLHLSTFVVISDNLLIFIKERSTSEYDLVIPPSLLPLPALLLPCLIYVHVHTHTHHFMILVWKKILTILRV